MKATSDPTKQGFDPDRLDRIGDWAQGYLDRGNLPCAITVVSRGGDIVYADARGVADTETAEPITFDHRFRIFSMTKPLTAVAAMMLVEQAKLRLGDRIDKYIPGFAKTAVLRTRESSLDDVVPLETPLTVHHLLTHTSGLTYGFFDPDTPLGEHYTANQLDMDPNGSPMTEWANVIASTPLAFQPGARWNYGISTDVLGHIIEIIEDAPLGEVFQKRILDPLGMSRTGFAVPEDKASELVTLYKTTTKGGLSLMDPGPTSAFVEPVTRHHGGGGLISVAEDYHRFMEMLRRQGDLDGQRLLAPSTVDLMASNALGGDLESMGQPTFGELSFCGVGFGLGMAVVLDPARAHLLTSPGEYFWGGAASTAFWIDPARDVTALFLTQLFPSSTYPLREELRALVTQALIAP